MKSLTLKNPWLVLALGLITGLSLFAAFLHHHEAHEEHENCPACRFVQAFSLLAFFTALLLIRPLEIRSFLNPLKQTFVSLILAASLKDRAPPSLSR